MNSFLERRFALTARGTTVRTEALGGLTTFLTMSYILFVNPAILSAAGMPFQAVIVATALAAAIASIAMGYIANVPFALASGLGINAVVAFTIVKGLGYPWEVAMACIVIEGLLALVLVIAGLREAIVRAVPMSMKLAIGVGIGLFITLVGLRQGGIVLDRPGSTGLGLGDLTKAVPLIALAGIFTSAALAVRNVRGSILIGVLTTALLGMIAGTLDWPSAIAQWPHSSDFSTIGDAWSHLGDALTWQLVPVIFALFMTDFFDTVGTAVAVGSAGGLLDEDGELPGIRRVLLVDSAAAAVGGTMGVSSVTTYVESGAGVAEGARTGLASVVTGLLFALAIFLTPVIAIVGQQVEFEGNFVSPAIAPALVMVGYLMMRIVSGIEWDVPELALPSFLVIAGIPLTFDIAAGIGFGVIGYVLAMIVRGRAREIHALMWALVPLFVAFYAHDWLSAHVF